MNNVTDPEAKRRVDQFQHRPPHELYDLTKDPFEMQNIADRPENAEVLEALQARLSQWREKQGDDVPLHGEKEYVAPN